MTTVQELKNLLAERTEDLRRRDKQIEHLERELDKKDATIRHLTNEIDKFRQVVRPLTQQIIHGSPQPGRRQEPRTKRQAISAEPLQGELKILKITKAPR